jgi:hypothetical protein
MTYIKINSEITEEEKWKNHQHKKTEKESEREKVFATTENIKMFFARILPNRMIESFISFQRRRAMK